MLSLIVVLLSCHVHITNGYSPNNFLFSLVYGDEVYQSSCSRFVIFTLSIRLFHLVSDILFYMCTGSINADNTLINALNDNKVYYVISVVLQVKFYTLTISCGELKTFMLEWGSGVFEEVQIDTEHFDLRQSLPAAVDEKVNICNFCGDVLEFFVQTLDELEKELDVDKDGKVTWPEFEKVFHKTWILHTDYYTFTSHVHFTCVNSQT